MNFLRQTLFFACLSYAAWTDLQEGVIDDRASLGMALCTSSLESMLSGLILAIVLLGVARKTGRIGEGDGLFLGGLAAALSSEEFAMVCCVGTSLMYIYPQTRSARPLAPYLWIVTAILVCGSWCRLPESNWPPTDYETVALPTELNRLAGSLWQK